MLHIVEKLRDLRFGMLMEVYAEGNRENGAERYPDQPENLQVMRAEADFYNFLQEVFFKTNGAVYAIWEENGRYVSALRLEPYRDGLLLEALETEPSQRGKGYAKALLRGVQSRLSGENRPPVYSHVKKRNSASLAVHRACGFRIISDHAVYADGSVLQNCFTLCW